MPRYALKIEYNGAPFAGWQRQKDLLTVQGAIETALSRIEAEVPSIAAAGRTDTGVHAIGQVAHCDMPKPWKPERIQGALNYHLKSLPVSIAAVAAVDAEFHARFSATGRRYLYQIATRRAPLVFGADQVWQIGHPLDCAAMQKAADYLIGHHDFTTFRSVQCQAQSPIKTLDRISISESARSDGTILYRFDIAARSFLHNQVRSFAGTLERVGAGSWAPERVKAALEAADRAACGPVAPPQGLTLTQVSYPEDPFHQD
jgi:tRNA pseudouridine38-40 synthase